MDLTLIVIFSTIVILVIFDVYIILKKGKYYSISAYIIRSSHSYPSIPFVLGFVCGHLFWSMDTSDWKLLPKEIKDSKIMEESKQITIEEGNSNGSQKILDPGAN